MNASSEQVNGVWRGSKVLVTGGSGFLGLHLCRALMEAGSEVHATSRRAREPQGDGVVWWAADMADLDSARRVLAAVRPAIVFHLAGAVGASPDLGLVLPTYHSLLTSTLNILLAATELGCRRIVLTASLTEPPAGAAEPVPASPYAAAKWASGGYARMFHRLYGTPAVIVRPFMTYGPNQAAGKIIPSVTNSLLEGTPPRLSSGTVKADWVYVADVVEGMLQAAALDGIEGMTFDLGTGSLVSMRALVERLTEIVGAPIAPHFGALPDRPGENEHAADTRLAAERLGWVATTSLDDGLRRTVDWYRTHGRPA